MTQVEKLISYSNALIEVLKDGTDRINLTRCLTSYEAFRSCCLNDSDEVHTSIQECEEKIVACKQKIHDTQSQVVSDEELEHLKVELEEELRAERLLREELRYVTDEIRTLDHQRVSIEHQKQVCKKIEKEELIEERMLSMYASVTNIIPELDDQFNISGHIVERDKKLVKRFKFESSEGSAIDVCNSIWKMISR